MLHDSPSLQLAGLDDRAPRDEPHETGSEAPRELGNEGLLEGEVDVAVADDTGEAGVPAAGEALADCVEESDRVLVMLQTLMDISEAESGAMPLQRAALDLHEVAARAVELYGEVADAKDVTVELTGDATHAIGDRVRLEQVAANLIDNAVKYTPEGGRVTVYSGTDGGQPLLRVSDTGLGIPADELPRIWDRLFRGDRSRTARGLGLGLSLVKAIVEAHGGKIWVEPRPGGGTVFRFTLRSADIEEADRDH